MVAMPVIALAFGGKKDDVKFEPGPASSYAARQTNDRVTVGAAAYTEDERARAAFGKHNPYQYGILPVLIVVQNDMDEPLRLTGIQAEFVQADGRHIEAVPPADIPATAARQPKDGAGVPPVRLPIPLPKKKNPLAGAEIDERSFSAKMLPPHDSAEGFFYFQTRLLPGAKLYLTGMQGARTGKGILYFEIPIEEDKGPAVK